MKVVFLQFTRWLGAVESNDPKRLSESLSTLVSHGTVCRLENSSGEVIAAWNERRELSLTSDDTPEWVRQVAKKAAKLTKARSKEAAKMRNRKKGTHD